MGGARDKEERRVCALGSPLPGSFWVTPQPDPSAPLFSFAK